MDQQQLLNTTEIINRLREENQQLRAAMEQNDCGRVLLKQKEEFSRLLSVSNRIVSELDVDKVFDLVAENARQIVQADQVLVPMLSEDRSRYTYVAAAGEDAEVVRGTVHKAHVGMCGWVLQHERSLLFGEESPYWIEEKTPWEAGQQSAVLVPLFGRKGIIGGLSALGKQGGMAFTRHDLDLLTMFANQVSISIENALLVQELVEKRDELTLAIETLKREVAIRRQAEEEIQNRADRINLLLHSTAEGIYGLNPDGNCTFFNSACRKLLGYGENEDLLGRHMHKLMHHTRPDKTHYPEQECKVYMALQNKKGVHVDDEVFWRADGTSFPVEYWSYPIIKNEEIVGTVVTFIDISERIKAGETKENLERQLRQAHKMEAIGTLAGGIAHDFNNILAIILGNADMAKDDIPEGNLAKYHIEQVLKASNRAKDLVKQILAFSRKSEQELFPIQPFPVIKESLKLLRSTTPASVSIVQDVREENCRILADATQIHQLLMNLFTNAVHAMDEKGVLGVTVKTVDLTAGEIAPHSGLTPGRHLQIMVSDTGTGMDKDTQERIFDPFFTTKEVDQGTGMGLSIVLGIVKSHNGHIAVDSSPGQGATFSLFFPVLMDAGPQDSEDAAGENPRGNERILFVDDEEMLAEMGSRILGRQGYTVTVKTGSLEALETFKANPHGFDLVITDQAMPNMTGIELASQLLAVRPGIPIILCTGFSKKVSDETARALGVKAFCIKPLDRKAISRLVRTVLDESKGS